MFTYCPSFNDNLSIFYLHALGVFQKELVLTSSYINPYTQRRALELIDSGRLDVSSMVAKVASLDELGAILSDPALRAMGKYIIDPSK